MLYTTRKLIFCPFQLVQYLVLLPLKSDITLGYRLVQYLLFSGNKTRYCTRKHAIIVNYPTADQLAVKYCISMDRVLRI